MCFIVSQKKLDYLKDILSVDVIALCFHVTQILIVTLFFSCFSTLRILLFLNHLKQIIMNDFKKFWIYAIYIALLLSYELGYLKIIIIESVIIVFEFKPL